MAVRRRCDAQGVKAIAALAAPLAAQKPPVAQAVQFVDRSSALNVPGGQLGHASSTVALSASRGLNVPGMHAAARRIGHDRGGSMAWSSEEVGRCREGA